ncbi:MAG: acetolactate synthase small subunit [Sedimentisphaerales bacterium]|nr:acetolactate synthase small subunit [Sedimentisphaerales bacterium]
MPQNRKHTLSALVQNQAGVLAHVAGMFAARGYNIDSLAVGRTEDPDLSRMTIVVRGDEDTLEQVRKQLGKIIPVVKVYDWTEQDLVQRDLMLVKVSATPERRPEIQSLIEMFQGKVVDIGPKFVMVEVTGPEAKIEAFLETCRPYGIKDVARTGIIAMPRHPRTIQTNGKE